uniref:B-related factor 1 n=1 Tax=Globodera pallida TaxID=36090 RepID=A0A183CG80_GLOPA
MTRTCPFCNCSEIEEDASRGDSICTGCGAVLEESTIVSDVQFQERGGGHEVVGQFVSRDRAQPTTIGGISGLSRGESREATFQKGRKRIQEISNQLHINQHCNDLAFGFFKMCVTKNLTRGRLRSHIVVACLYMACRSENTSHLLLDFSDATQINIFELGRTLNFLTRSLFIKLPPTDPCMYVLRFSAMLDFGDQQKEVALLATRIIQRMKRDWMSTGRRPTGICGAALLLAARALNLNRTVTDVVHVVNISYAVVKRRLDEFANTPSGALTIDEFSTVDLEESEDPPAFRESKRKQQEEKRRKEEEIVAESALKEFEPVRLEVEQALLKRFKRSPYAKMIADGLVDDIDVPELSQASEMLQGEVIDTVYELSNEQQQPGAMSNSGHYVRYGPSLASLGISKEQHQQRIEQSEIPPPAAAADQFGCAVSVPNEDIDLTGIDDDEINSYILTDVETSVKEKYWMKQNAKHLEVMEERKRQRQEEEEQRQNKETGPKRRKRAPNVRKREINAVTHNDAMLHVIQERNLSSKINYDILKQLDDES